MTGTIAAAVASQTALTVTLVSSSSVGRNRGTSCSIPVPFFGSASVSGGGLKSEQGSSSWVLRGQGGASKGSFPWFKFGKNGLDSEGAGIYGSQKREDFDRDDVEQYFNYMGMLATEGTYAKMEALLNTGIQAVDILLLLAASEGDTPKIEELLQAGADYRVKDDKGRNALDRAQDEDIRELILSNSQVKA